MRQPAPLIPSVALVEFVLCPLGDRRKVRSYLSSLALRVRLSQRERMESSDTTGFAVLAIALSCWELQRSPERFRGEARLSDARAYR